MKSHQGYNSLYWGDINICTKFCASASIDFKIFHWIKLWTAGGTGLKVREWPSHVNPSNSYWTKVVERLTIIAITRATPAEKLCFIQLCKVSKCNNCINYSGWTSKRPLEYFCLSARRQWNKSRHTSCQQHSRQKTKWCRMVRVNDTHRLTAQSSSALRKTLLKLKLREQCHGLSERDPVGGKMWGKSATSSVVPLKSSQEPLVSEGAKPRVILKVSRSTREKGAFTLVGFNSSDKSSKRRESCSVITRISKHCLNAVRNHQP